MVDYYILKYENENNQGNIKTLVVEIQEEDYSQDTDINHSLLITEKDTIDVKDLLLPDVIPN